MTESAQSSASPPTPPTPTPPPTPPTVPQDSTPAIKSGLIETTSKDFYPITSVLEGLRETNPADFGKGIGPSIIVGLVNHLAREHADRKQELDEVRRELDATKIAFADLKVLNAKQEGKIASLLASKKFGHFAATVGAVLIGLSVRLLSSEQIGIGLSLALIGSLALIISWFF